MSAIVWDKPDERVYENGIDKGVLYLPNGAAVPWNGLTAVVETFEDEVSSSYFDGTKTQDFIALGSFAATLKAITYPDEFIELEGYGSPRPGLFLTHQRPKLFCLCYRTLIGNAIDQDAGYKLHIIYNLLAVPKEKSHETLAGSQAPMAFEWSITAVPCEVPGFRPTAQLIIDSRTLSPEILSELEDMLYGTETESPVLLPMDKLVEFLTNWYLIKIIDNGDGTFTAISYADGLIEVDGDEITINSPNIIFLNAEADYFQISDTFEIPVSPDVIFTDNGDGTWTATTDRDELFTVNADGTFEIREVTAFYADRYIYRVEATE